MNVVSLSSILVRFSNNCFLKNLPKRAVSSFEFHSRYFSSSIFQNIPLKPRHFYQIPPPHQNDVLVANKNKEAFSHFHANKKAFVEGQYSNSNNFMRSWLLRSTDPETFWETLSKSSQSDHEATHSLFPGSQEIHSVNFKEILKEKGGGGLTNVSHEDLIKIWEYFKKNNECDKMVELFHCRRPSKFTASSGILLDYCFAHLKSSYCQPVFIANIAKRLVEKQNLSQVHYLLGLSNIRCAHVAKKLGDLVEQGEKNRDLIARYRECFGHATFKESHLKYQESLKLAELNLKKAFNIEFNCSHALALILNLIEQGQLTEAGEVSDLVWLRLNKQPFLTTQDAQTLVMAGLVSQKSHVLLENIAQKMLVEEPELKTEYLENLNVLIPHFPDAQKMGYFHNSVK